MPNYADLWRMDNQVNKEVVYAVSYSTNLSFNDIRTEIGHQFRRIRCRYHAAAFNDANAVQRAGRPRVRRPVSGVRSLGGGIRN